MIVRNDNGGAPRVPELRQKRVRIEESARMTDEEASGNDLSSVVFDPGNPDPAGNLCAFIFAVKE